MTSINQRKQQKRTNYILFEKTKINVNLLHSYRIKTISLQKIKAKLVQEVELVESESKCVKNFQIELDLLIQEKIAHLEELRQIQNDILTVRDFQRRNFSNKNAVN